MKIILDYIWIDGNTISDIRYITKIIDADFRKFDGVSSYFGNTPRLLDQQDDDKKIPEITIDGNFTNQKTDDNLITLKPVKLYINPIKVDSYYVLCEPYNGGIPHESNSRFNLNEKIKLEYDSFKDSKMFALKQGFVLSDKGDSITSYNENVTNVYSSNHTGHENIVNEFINNTIKMGINIDTVINKFDRCSKWEVLTSLNGILTTSDDILIIRHLLNRLASKHKTNVSFDRKFFHQVKEEKDQINEPYLLMDKLLKSLSD